MKSRSGGAVPSGVGAEGAGGHAQAGTPPQARVAPSPAAPGQSSVADQRTGAAPANGMPAGPGGRAGTPATAAAQPAGRARPLPPPGGGRSSQPSWATVLVTTVRLWAQRRRQRRGKQPASRQPAPGQPGVSRPSVSQPALSEQAMSQRSVSQPGLSRPAASQPAVSERTASQRSVSQPAVSQPAVSEQAASQRGVSQPAARRPAVERPSSRRRAIAVVAVLAVAAVAAVATVVVVSGNSSPGAPARRTTAKQHRPSPVRPTATPAAVAEAVAAARKSAATWVAQQINRSAVVACDPAMCAALAAKGVPSARLHVLPPGQASLSGAGIVVATPVVRSALGTSLAGEDAPVAVAHFGTGAARIDVRVVAPDGAAGYRGAMAADVVSRQKAGARLLHDHRIRLSATGRAQIHAGEIDPRLLAALAGLARRRPIHVIEFTATPGAAPGPEIPMRLAEIQGMGRFGGTPVTIRALRGLLSRVRPPFHPAVLVTLRLAPHRLALRIGYRAPTPLGLLGPKGTLPHRA
jgi:hypothetical protein